MPIKTDASADPLDGVRDDNARVIVAGAGVVGLVLGIALARAGIATVVAGRVQSRMPGRTVALLEGSISFLKTLDLWQDLSPEAEPLRVMRLVDDTGSLFRVPPVDFRAQEIGRDWFGFNIENDRLVDRLASIARRTPGLHVVERHLETLAFGEERVSARTEDGTAYSGQILAAADGRRSPARTAARLTAKTWSYPQVALTAILAHSVDHNGTSTEFHTREGPFTLVPLRPEDGRPEDGRPEDGRPEDGRAKDGRPETPYRSSLVWVMAPHEAERRSALDAASLAGEIERQSRRLLGRITVVGPTGRFPIAGMMSDRMIGPRLALAGEAAHAFPPIGAQGLNLGLRDVAALADHLGAAAHRKADLGTKAVLESYERSRRGDVALRTMGVDWLNRALLSDILPVDLLRGAGLLALGAVGPLRRFAMRQGL